MSVAGSRSAPCATSPSASAPAGSGKRKRHAGSRSGVGWGAMVMSSSVSASVQTLASRDRVTPMLNATRDLVLPTTITGSYPRPAWVTEGLGDSAFREQYFDAAACLMREQERAGLDIVSDGDARFDLTVGGRSWFFYPLERLRGITRHVDRPSAGGGGALRPGHILYEVQEAWQPPILGGRVEAGPLDYAALFKVAQRFS